MNLFCAEVQHRSVLPLCKRVAAVAAVMLLAGADVRAVDNCQVSSEQAGFRFPMDRLDQESRCLVAPVVNEHSTTGLVGPVQTPIAPDLFAYLLDRPPVLAALVERLNLGKYKFFDKGNRQYWVDDGEGTQGLLTVVYRDESIRIYHLDGYHEGSIMPTVKAKAVVFLRLQPTSTHDGHPAVQSNLVAYTKLKDSFLATVVRLLRPLVGGMVTRKLSRGFEVTGELGTLIAQDPGRVAKEAASLKGIGAEDLRTLDTLLHEVPVPSSSSTVRSSP